MTEPKINGFHSTVTTSNGTYKVGMTRKQAEAAENYKKFTGLDFKDLDTDNNGVLSQKEILEGRYKSAKRKESQKRNIGTAVGAAAALAIPFTGGLSGLGFACVSAYGFGYAIDHSNVTDEILDATAELERYKLSPQSKKDSINTKA